MNPKYKVHIYNSLRKDKRFTVSITDLKTADIKTVHFGDKKAKNTYFDGATDEKRDAYIKRHSKLNEDWTKDGLFTAGWWSRWFLWSHYELEDILKTLKKQSGGQIQQVQLMDIKRKKV